MGLTGEGGDEIAFDILWRCMYDCFGLVYPETAVALDQHVKSFGVLVLVFDYTLYLMHTSIIAIF